MRVKNKFNQVENRREMAKKGKEIPTTKRFQAGQAMEMAELP